MHWYGTAAHVERIVRDNRRYKEAEELSREAQQQSNRRLTATAITMEYW